MKKNSNFPEAAAQQRQLPDLQNRSTPGKSFLTESLSVMIFKP